MPVLIYIKREKIVCVYLYRVSKKREIDLNFKSLLFLHTLFGVSGIIIKDIIFTLAVDIIHQYPLRKTSINLVANTLSQIS